MMKMGRNQLCPCGSGRKYKNCCWLKDRTKGKAKKHQRSRNNFKDVKLRNTFQKLANCRIILNELEGVKNEPEKFAAILEAFIECARSITWIFQNEFRSNEFDLEEWYQNKVDEMKHPINNLLQFFRDKRNIITKERSIDTKTITYIKDLFIKEVPQGWNFIITSRGEPVWVKDPGTAEEIKIHASEFDSETDMKYFFDDSKPPQNLFLNGKDCSYFDVLTLCKLYYGYLNDLIKEAEKKLANSRSQSL